MPQTVEIPGQGIAEFPDEMTPNDIKGVIRNKFYGQNVPSLPTQEITPDQPRMGLGEMLFGQPTTPTPSGYAGRGEFSTESGAQSAPIVTEQAQDPLAKVAKGFWGAFGAMVPKSTEDILRMTTLPRPSEFETKDLPESEELGAEWRGERGLEAQAGAITGTGLQALPLAHLPFAESPLRPTPRDLALVKSLRTEQGEVLPQIPETPISDTAQPLAEVSAETPTTVGETTATRQAEPVEQPAQGFVRLYHGGGEAAGEAGRDFTTSKQYAEDYAAKAEADGQGKATVWSVDIPEGSLKTHDETGQPMTRVVVPDEVRNQASPVSEAATEYGLLITQKPAAETPPTVSETTTGGQAYTGARPVSETLPPSPASEALPSATSGEGVADTGSKPVAAPVPEAESATTAAPLSKEQEPPISTKNEYTEAQRAVREFPEAEQAARRDFGTVWDEAATEAEKDPSIGRRLVNELNNKPREVSDTENAHLLRTQIATQTEHSAAVEAVNSAKTPEDLAAAKSRLELARQDLQEVYDATKRAGTKSGQALASRQMLAKEDYTLAAMESRRRAANDGAPLNEAQLGEVSELHEKIADLQSKLDAHEVAQRFNTEFSRLVNETRKEARASKATTKFNDFMDRKATEARARIVERRGRLTTGFDPTMIADEAIVGASHIAKGITKFADWSVKMVDEFGDAVRPFLKDIWEKAKTFHSETGKEYGEKGLARYKTYLSKQTEQIKGKIEAGDFTKAERQRTQLDAEAFTMRANLQKLKNQFERGVSKEAYNKKSPSQKFWDHFVGVERAMKLSGPEVFGKLGVAAAAREAVLAPTESAVGYGVSKLFPRLTEGTKYGADLSTVIRAELKAKAALFTKGMQEAAQNVAGKETELEAIGDKSGRRPEFWYNRIGKMHAAIKAPIKRAEFTRSLEQRMDAAVKAGEDIHHPEVMTRLANEAVMDANRAIFQQNTVVSSFFSVLDRQSPAAGRVARFLFPVVKIPVNIFKEVLTYHAGAPAAAVRIGKAYMKGVETLPVPEREAIVRQLTKGSVGGAALLWGYFNSDKVRDFFDHAPRWFNHTPIAMVLNEGSYLKKLQGTDTENKEGKQQLAHMAKTDIPFMYTITDITKAIDSHQSNAFLGWINNMVQSTVVPQLATQVAKAADKPGSFPSNLSERTNYRVARNPVEAVKLGVPGLRKTVPQKGSSTKQVFQ